MKIIKFYFLIIFLCLWWLDFEFVNRLGVIQTFNFSIFKIISPVLALFVFFTPPKKMIFSIIQKKIISIIIVVFFITHFALFFSLFNLNEVPFSISYRYLIQIFSFITSILLPFFLIQFLISKPDSFYRFLKLGYILMFVSVVWQLSSLGFAFFPRLFGLTGEPKSLGIYLVPFIISLLFVSTENKYKKNLYLYISLTFLLFTFSSTAFIALILSIIILFLLKPEKIRFNRKLIFNGFVIGSLFIVLIFFSDFYEIIIGRIINRSNGEFVSGIQTVIDLPIFGKVTVDGNDAPVARMFMDKPWLLFSGVGYGFQTVFSYDYLLKYDSGFLDSFYTGYITPNIALLNHLSNYGLVIFLIMLIDGLNTIKKLLKINLNLKHKFLIIYFSSWFIISALVYEMTFKIIFLYILLKMAENYFNKINISVA